MCTYSITLNDKLVDQVRSEFPNEESLRQWLEKQMEEALMRFGERKKNAVPCSYTEEELYTIVQQRLQSLENGTATLVDGEEVFAQIESRYGFKA